VVASFAVLASKKVLRDADVAAAVLQFIMDSEVKTRADFQTGYKAKIDKAKFSE
jgi:MinD superfamily P-loop ATPase